MQSKGHIFHYNMKEKIHVKLAMVIDVPLAQLQQDVSHVGVPDLPYFAKAQSLCIYNAQDAKELA